MTKPVREEIYEINQREWANLILRDRHAALDQFNCPECGDSGIAVGYRKEGNEYVRFTEPCQECSKGRSLGHSE